MEYSSIVVQRPFCHDQNPSRFSVATSGAMIKSFAFRMSIPVVNSTCSDDPKKNIALSRKVMFEWTKN